MIGTELELSGGVIRPGDSDYETARRIWNGAIDRRPALIARCASEADVAAALMFARAEGLAVAVRGGGHNVAGTAVCDGGLVIDLSGLKEITVDPAGRRAKAQPGLRWGEFDRATQGHGLATPGGIVTDTGVAGLTLGGGIGWLMRRHGLTCDNLRTARVLTAAGELVIASEDEDADLLWALRGGGGNFGIVTEFEFRLHPVGPTVLAGPVIHPAARAREVLRFYNDFAASAPEDLTTIVSLRTAPPLPWVPEELWGTRVVMIVACWSGDLTEGERSLRPLREFGPPAADLVVPKPYTEHQGMFDASVPAGLGYYWKSHYLPPLTDGAIEAIVEHAWAMRSPMSYTLLFHMGGAIRLLDQRASAFGGRDAEYAINVNGVWKPGEEPLDVDWARRFWEATRPHATGGVYVNFLGSEGRERVRAAYGEAIFAKLSTLKTRYDPENVFRVNQNVPPAA